MWTITWSNPSPGAPRLADRGPAGGEALVADVPGLAEEGLEATQPVGRPVAGARVARARIGHLELEVLTEVAQPPEHGGLAQPRARVQLRRQPGDLPGGQEASPGPQHPEHRVVHVRTIRRIRFLRSVRLGRARVLQRAPDSRTQRVRDRRRERIADLPVARGLAAAQPPAPVVLPALQPGHHLAGQPRPQRYRSFRSRGAIRHPDAVHAELGPGALGPGGTQVGAAVLLGP